MCSNVVWCDLGRRVGGRRGVARTMMLTEKLLDFLDDFIAMLHIGVGYACHRPFPAV